MGKDNGKEPQLPRQHPSPHQRDGKALQDRGLVQVAGKGLLARLMPKQRTAGIGADGPAQKRPSQQHPLGHPPRAVRGTDLVKTEQHERPQIDQRKQAKGIGEGEEGWEGHEFASLIKLTRLSILCFKSKTVRSAGDIVTYSATRILCATRC